MMRIRPKFNPFQLWHWLASDVRHMTTVADVATIAHAARFFGVTSHTLQRRLLSAFAASAVVLLLALPQVGEARSCDPANGNSDIPGNMWILIRDMSPTWDDRPPRIGVKHLFAQGECTGCHSPDNTGDNAHVRFFHCANCHDTAITNQRPPPIAGTNWKPIYPDWLRFDTPAKLKRNSYYMAGMSKAEASIRRSREGSMPPGAWHQGFGQRAGQSVGWCTEIEAIVQTWIDGGFQQ